ncbi:protein Dok-7 [Thalassophryne amazonica]|uniref:protein Dok-7 n=1 Tax=Thalassophryne amazonica TaxID=390379 RepID=UPI0014721969|nr:protein Dok-7 [Thalassophryne amazonica]
MTDTVVVEGQVKFRDGKKVSSARFFSPLKCGFYVSASTFVDCVFINFSTVEDVRWVVLRKPSPVADCLSVLVFKGRKKGKEKGRSHKERLSVTLEDICGVDSGPGYDGMSFTLSILSLRRTLVLGFRCWDTLLAWDARIRYSLGEVPGFSVDGQPGTSLETGPASPPPVQQTFGSQQEPAPCVIGQWKLSALRRYGAVPNGFVFEGGTRCGSWAGVFFLSSSEGEQISFLFDCIVRGFAPSRAPRGMRPALPDPNADSALAEERISREASDLEKRLSMLSHCSQASSAASTYSCSTSVAGDDRSSISSSSSSQTEASFGSRLPLWVDPGARLHLSNETRSSSSTLKCLTCSDERLYAAVNRPSSGHLGPRGLHDSGRQSSLDSGIGIAASSQSSYSGSFSSCTGSLDVTSQGGGEEFDAPPAATPPPAIAAPEHSSAASPCSCPSRPSSQTSCRNSDKYHIPNLLRPWYDTPRSLLQTPSLWERSAQGGAQEQARGCRSSGDRDGSQGQERSDLAGSRTRRQDKLQRSHSWGSDRAPPVASEGRPTPRELQCCLVCGETQSDARYLGFRLKQ